ncbi:24716_t:CDS:2 [Gigaspora margarita]|uniref:24716_t:CDS:1 n=1 Tax=Gigaspora margarita TaxID=4874 RepID=A0ABN7W7C3_GIGMA|nr:24716_t:CDS:2 [Gigaspora margarita]
MDRFLDVDNNNEATGPEDEPVIEVYATKRRKRNNSEATEVKTSESNKKDLINEAYFYMKLWEANDELKICKICLKKEKEFFNLGPLTIGQEVDIKNLLEEYNNIIKKETGQLGKTAIIQYKIIIVGGLSIKQRFYPTSKPKHEFISAEIY